MLGSSTESPGAKTSMQVPNAVSGERTSVGALSESRRTRDAPTTMAPGELPGEMWQASISRLPAETTTGMPAARSCATALSSAGIAAAVSAMNDQLATARWPG